MEAIKRAKREAMAKRKKDVDAKERREAVAAGAEAEA